MFLKKKKFYTLLDIKNQIVYTPLIFVIILAILSFLILFIFLSYQENNRIKLLIQSENFYTKDVLKNYVGDIKYTASGNLDSVEIDLSNSIYEINGYIKSFSITNKNLQAKELKGFISELEKSSGIKFVLFNSENYEVLYGFDLIDHLRGLTSSKIKTEKFRESMLKNIQYIGDDNLMYWIDNQKRDFRLSYFKNIPDYNLFIGAFSKIDDMKALTKKAVLDSLVAKSRTINHAHLAFYDKNTQTVYNYYGKGKSISVEDINGLTQINDKNLVYSFSKYQYKVYVISSFLEDEIKKIRATFDHKLVMGILSIVLAAIFLMTASNIFGRFINTIFNRYNRRLERKNLLFKKWKDRYELAIIASNDGLWDLNLDTNEIFFSNKWLEMFSYDRDDISTFEQWKELIHSEDKPLVLKQFEELISKKSEHFICEYRLRDKKDNYKWLLVRGKAFRSDKANRVLMMSMDIDNRKRLTKELKNVEVLTEVGRIVIFRWRNNKDLSASFVSNSIESYGYASEDFTNENIKYLDFVHKDDIQELKEIINKTIKNDNYSFSHIHRVINKDGQIRWVYNRTILIKDDNGKVRSLFGYINDITTMKMNEEELKEKVKVEVEKNIEKDRLLNQQNKLASMGEMLGNIAHQWRQPLNNISLLVHFIRDSYGVLSKEDLHEAINSVKVQIDYMSQTIDDFRNFYQPNKDKFLFSIKESIEQSFKIVSASFERNDIDFKILGDKVKINSYENEFEQVIVNILNNAVDAALVKKEKVDFKAKVRIKIKKEEKIVIIISNNCGRVSEDILHKMFEPYFTTKFENQGTGIGLYMVKVIIEKNMGGKIEASNTKEGVKFTIII